ncbi:hypothetical protein ACFCX8_12055 [Streptomyces chartreusis]|uniref:hypothetical protein n=1 Tax=Streptomyces chartreusis TaxID=1969 RepID=UPI0035D54C14
MAGNRTERVAGNRTERVAGNGISPPGTPPSPAPTPCFWPVSPRPRAEHVWVGGRPPTGRRSPSRAAGGPVSPVRVGCCGATAKGLEPALSTGWTCTSAA